MTKQTINIGSSANSRNGDPLRTAFDKVNQNFTELYNMEGVGGASVTVDTAPPESPTEGSLWWNTEDGKLYINYNDAWVDTSSPAGGTTGDIGFDADNMYRLDGLSIGNSDLTHGATANIIIPANGGDSIQLQSLYGGVTIGTGPDNAVTNIWSFRDDASVIFPNGELLISETNQLYFTKEHNGVVSSIVLHTGEAGFSAVNSDSVSIFQVRPTEVRLTINENIWSFDNGGTLQVPHLLPVTFTAVLDTAHMVDPTALSDDPWEFEVSFQVDPNGQVETQIGNNTPWITNPGYSDGKEFTFTDADHGIPGYTFTLGLTDIQHPGGAGWTTNLTASIAPTYSSTISSDGAVKITSNDNDWVFGTLGDTTFPTSGDVFLPNSLKITQDSTTSIVGKSTSETITVEEPGGTVSSTSISESQVEIDPTSVIVARRSTSIVDDGVVTTTDVAGTQLEISNGLASLKLYQEPDGPNNSVYFQVKATNSGAILEAVQEDVGGSVAGRVTVQETSVSVFVGDGVTDSTWTFGIDGSFELPTGGEIKTEIGTGDVIIEANDGTARTWTFGGDGNLTTPGSILFPTSGLGAPTVSTRSAGTKLVIWPEVNVSGHADYAIGMADSVLWQTVPTTGQSFKWYGGATLALTVKGDGSLIPTNSIYAKSGDGTLGLIFSPDGTNNHGNITVNSAYDMTTQVSGGYSVALSGNERFKITLQDTTLTGGNDLYIKSNKNTSEYSWKFDTAGKLITPGEIWTKAGDGIQGLTFSPDGSNSSAYIKVDGGQNCVFQANGNIYLKRSSNDRLAITNTKTTLSAATDIELKAYGTQTWTFGANVFILPDGSLQNTGYWVATAPTTSKGVSGDTAGMVAFDNGNFYYCKTTYTDGVADIWVKTAWTSTSW